jgi:hypothetical protein
MICFAVSKGLFFEIKCLFKNTTTLPALQAFTGKSHKDNGLSIPVSKPEVSILR